MTTLLLIFTAVSIVTLLSIAIDHFRPHQRINRRKPTRHIQPILTKL